MLKKQIIKNFHRLRGVEQKEEFMRRNGIKFTYDSFCNMTVWAVDVHHDGVNYYEFREIREDRNIQNLLDAIYSGKKVTRKMMNYYTKSLHKRVAAVYGW